MNFLVVTFAPTLRIGGEWYSYGPYVQEMDLWFENFESVRICSPVKYSYGNLLLRPFKRKGIEVVGVPEVSLLGFKNIFLAVALTPLIAVKIIHSFVWADHIHLRVPGNISLIASIVQIFFPRKVKTAKYAGNWGENLGQPWSYRFQKWILGNSVLTRNIKVLVYGEWPGQSKNVIPFFTASYSLDEVVTNKQRVLDGVIKLVYVGTLIRSKNPLVAVQVAESLLKLGLRVHLEFLGDGPERVNLEQYVRRSSLSSIVSIHGNVSREVVKGVLQEAHFLVFLSNSEGWPKVVAESMFWGCVPITKRISCVPWMLADGRRGLLVSSMNADDVAHDILDLVKNGVRYQAMSSEAAIWSRNYTLDKFKVRIKELL